MRDQNWHPKIVESYLIKHYKNERSRKTVRVYLKVFFTIINKEPERWLKQSEKTIKEDLWTLAQKIENKPNKTQSTIFTLVKKYLERHNIQLKPLEWEELRLRNNLVKSVRPLVKKATPTQHDLKKILSFASNIKTKAFFILLASSGLRRDELLQLTWNDIDIKNRMIILPEDIAKGKIPRFTYFSEEARELLELWKPEREKLLLKLHRKSTILRNILQKKGYELKKVKGYWKVYKDRKELTEEEVIKLDNRVFPYEAENFEKIWIRLLEKAGEPYNKRDDNDRLQYPRYAYNIHSLRRFWFTQLRSDRMNDEFYNYIGGHTSLLDRTYGDWLHD
ncbi:MAG TPA: site-specific integrase, partial [Candidatus Thermoplasmatota archaeon]|nr:site-specific integrase [Candidatus Thermoplasmatota archaeon]